MPKIKTNRAANKRFKRTANGGFKRARAYGRHLKATKNPKRIRRLRQIVMVDARDVPRVKGLLPYA